ncbi:O-methyltransferase [candidate division KSB1 bacterium]
MVKSMYSFLLIPILILLSFSQPCIPQEISAQQEIDRKVKEFLDDYRWRDLNVPEVDGKILYDLIIENKYKSALEVGTSTGHSGIWIAWALSKTGGKLITIEIDRRRHEQAVANFRECGLEEFIDARLTDAHELVPELEGPFDFVFIDADKDWYPNYAKAIIPKLVTGGCITAHNVSERGRGRRGRGGRGGYESEYLEYMRSLPFMETTLDLNARSGLAVSYKRKDR